MSQDIKKKLKILYIDDDILNRSLITRLLSIYNFIVLEADNGLDGIVIARKEIPDLILMDIDMPGLDGHETTTRMQSIPALAQIPIVALTARSTKGERELALAAGCNGYMTKPIDVEQFPHQIMTYIDGYRDSISPSERAHYLDQYSQKLVRHLESKVVELQEANRQLQKIDKLKSDFITLAAHELRTPLTLVSGYTHLLQETVANSYKPEGDDDIGDLSSNIYEAVHRLTEVVNDILNISLIESNEMHVLYRPLSLSKIINEAIQELDPTKHNRDLEIIVKDMTTLPQIFGDREKLQQVFWNIISNAIKFTPDKGIITIDGRAVDLPLLGDTNPTGKQQEKGVIVMVKDTGIGIDPAEQKDIFKRFYIVGNSSYHSSSKTEFGGGGMGLGLPIARGIIKAHNGQIWTQSNGRNAVKNPGSKFFVLLPCNSGTSPN